MFPSINRAQTIYSSNTIDLTNNERAKSALIKNISGISNTHDETRLVLNTAPQKKGHGATDVKASIATSINENILEIPEPDYRDLIVMLAIFPQLLSHQIKHPSIYYLTLLTLTES